MRTSKRTRRLAALIACPLLAGMLVAGAAAPGAALAAELWLFLDKIPGEATEEGHVREIALLSYSQSVLGGGRGATGVRGGAAGTCGPITVTKLIDAASPKLIGAALSGLPIGTGVIAAATSNHAPFDYYRLTLSDVSIESVVPSHSGNPSGTIVESVSMSAARFEIVYTPTSIDGSAQGEVKFAWNCDQGKAR